MSKLDDTLAGIQQSAEAINASFDRMVEDGNELDRKVAAIGADYVERLVTGPEDARTAYRQRYMTHVPTGSFAPVLRPHPDEIDRLAAERQRTASPIGKHNFDYLGVNSWTGEHEGWCGCSNPDGNGDGGVVQFSETTLEAVVHVWAEHMLEAAGVIPKVVVA